MWWLLACASQAPAPEALPEPPPPPEPVVEAEAEPEPTVEPSEAQLAMHRALSARDPVPPCDEVAALADDPATDWKFLAEHVEQPPWVALRAAGCFVPAHGAAHVETLESWVTEAQFKGLGWAVLERMDPLGEETVLHLATLALESGSDPDKARSRLLSSQYESVRALAEQ